MTETAWKKEKKKKNFLKKQGHQNIHYVQAQHTTASTGSMQSQQVENLMIDKVSFHIVKEGMEKCYTSTHKLTLENTKCFSYKQKYALECISTFT